MTTPRLGIGRLTRQTGGKVKAIRWYEEIGFIPAPGRTPGNRRAYGAEHAARLPFIRHSRGFGFPLVDARGILVMGDRPGESCEAVNSVARRHLNQVGGCIEPLKALELDLEHMIERCRGGKGSDCHIIEVLWDHCHAPRLSDGRGSKIKRRD